MQSKYQKLEILGEGTYGTVYMCRNRETGKLVATKLLKQYPGDEGLSATTMREITLLLSLVSPYVVKLLEADHVVRSGEETETTIVFEYLYNNLSRYIRQEYGKGKPVPLSTARHFTYQILLGMQHCHASGVMHCDLKPANILYDKSTNSVKIADLGLARQFHLFSRRYTHEVQTLYYRAPEVLLGMREYTSQIDMWSVGCILGEMLLGRPLFLGESELGQLLSIFRKRGTPSEVSWPGRSKLPDWHIFPEWPTVTMKEAFKWPVIPDGKALDLMERLLTCSPKKRLTAMQAINHPYFDEIRVLYPKPSGSLLIGMAIPPLIADRKHDKNDEKEDDKENILAGEPRSSKRRRVELRERNLNEMLLR